VLAMHRLGSLTRRACSMHSQALVGFATFERKAAIVTPKAWHAREQRTVECVGAHVTPPLTAVHVTRAWMRHDTVAGSLTGRRSPDYKFMHMPHV